MLDSKEQRLIIYDTVEESLKQVSRLINRYHEKLRGNFYGTIDKFLPD